MHICEAGLHASERLLDALGYAPIRVTWLHRVTLESVASQEDKHAGSARRIEASYSCEQQRTWGKEGEAA